MRATDESELVALSHDALIVTDGNGKIRFANQAASSLLRASPKILQSRLLVSHVDPAHRRAFRAHLNRAAAGEALHFSFELAPPRAPPFPVRARVAPVESGLGWVLRRESAAPPATDFSGSDQPARAELGRVLDGVRDGVIVLGRDGRVEFANRPAQAMFAPHPVVPGELVPDPWSVSIRHLATELFLHDAFNAEALIDVDAGTAYWVRAHRSGEGETAVLLLSDVSAEERREQAERDFIAHAAHELQSPLTGIAGAVEVLLDGAHEDGEARVRFLQHIARENDRLARLLRSLLVLAQAQAADTEAELEPFDLLPLIEDVVRAGPKADAVHVVCPSSLRVVAQPERVRHALAHLLDNAVRHGRSPRIVVTGRRDRRGAVQVAVTDFGRGIAPDEMTRVFERFYRSGPRTAEGFGLGLSIAQQAAHAMGGELEVRPNPRGGTIATLTLRGAA